MKYLLLQFALDSTIVVNGYQAIALVKNRLRRSATLPMYQLIFCDYSMPRMDGFECIREIRNAITEWRQLKSNESKDNCSPRGEVPQTFSPGKFLSPSSLFTIYLKLCLTS